MSSTNGELVSSSNSKELKQKQIEISTTVKVEPTSKIQEKFCLGGSKRFVSRLFLPTMNVE